MPSNEQESRIPRREQLGVSEKLGRVVQKVWWDMRHNPALFSPYASPLPPEVLSPEDEVARAFPE